ncbi:MAG: acyl carrier protein [Gammaproteobacteria bacterium]|nr:acyl carrier protein [Gammaproteobacteria bacterium]
MHRTVEQIIAEVFEVDESSLSDDLTPETVDRWDSLNHFRLITALEQAFRIKLSMREIQSLESIGKIREVVDRHTSEQSETA